MRTLTVALAGVALAASPISAQSLQYKSPAGVEYRSQYDTGGVRRAQAALDADPTNVDKIIALGVAQSTVRKFREAIETFTKGLALQPKNAMLFRWRGHRFISVRDFDSALNDLAHGLRLDSTNYGILYHLGVVRYVKGDFNGAVVAFRRAIPHAPDAAERAGATDWLWMSLQRAGKKADAKAMLDSRPDTGKVSNAYTQRLKLYRGQMGPEAVITKTDTTDVQKATLSYGIGNWYLVRGDAAKARTWFERAIKSGGWPAFGFIVAEVELRRLQ